MCGFLALVLQAFKKPLGQQKHFGIPLMLVPQGRWGAVIAPPRTRKAPCQTKPGSNMSLGNSWRSFAPHLCLLAHVPMVPSQAGLLHGLCHKHHARPNRGPTHLLASLGAPLLRTFVCSLTSLWCRLKTPMNRRGCCTDCRRRPR